MGSDGGGGGNPALLMMGGQPIGGLPIAGQGANIDPFKYGKFQNFLPDIPTQAETDAGARAPSATGLTKEMFTYRGPDGSVADSPSGGGGVTSADIQGLRDQLSQLISQRGGGQPGGMPDAAYWQAYQSKMGPLPGGVTPQQLGAMGMMGGGIPMTDPFAQPNGQRLGGS